MPLYDFQCQACNHAFEDIKLFNDPNPLCPVCQSTTDCLFSLPTSEASPKYKDMHRKAVLMKKRMTGQLPWLKHSESQTD